MQNLFEDSTPWEPWTPPTDQDMEPWSPPTWPDVKLLDDWTQPLTDVAIPVDDVIVIGHRTSSNNGWSGGAYDSSWFDWDGYDSNQDAYRLPSRRVPTTGRSAWIDASTIWLNKQRT